MRIACIIQGTPPTRYFANTVNASFPVGLVIANRIPQRQRRGVVRSIRAAGRKHGLVRGAGVVAFARLRNLGRRVLGSAPPRENAAALYTRFFDAKWRRLAASIRTLEVSSSNQDTVLDALESMRPDVLLVHGGPIVRDEILATADIALNLHWGLSPYYRGSRCTEWALVNWDPRNIGVTIHLLTREIDGGGIVAQARAQITADDTVGSINMQLTQLGTSLVLETLQCLSAGASLHPEPQDLNCGFVRSSWHWGSHLGRHLDRMLRNGALAKMLTGPAREERLPLVSLADTCANPLQRH